MNKIKKKDYFDNTTK